MNSELYTFIVQLLVALASIWGGALAVKRFNVTKKESLSKTIDLLSDRVYKVEQRNDELQTEFNKVQDEMGEMRSENESLKKEIEILRAENQVLRLEVSKLKDENTDLKLRRKNDN